MPPPITITSGWVDTGPPPVVGTVTVPRDRLVGYGGDDRIRVWFLVTDPRSPSESSALTAARRAVAAGIPGAEALVALVEQDRQRAEELARLVATAKSVS